MASGLLVEALSQNFLNYDRALARKVCLSKLQNPGSVRSLLYRDNFMDFGGGMSIGATGRGDANRVRSMGTAKLLASVGLATALLIALSAGPASAQANWTGLTGSDWMDGGNWTTAAPPIPGQTVNIGVLGSPPQSETILGVGGPVSVSVGAMSVGNSGGVAGNLTIKSGSTLTSTGNTRIGISATGIGTVTVTGPGSQWLITAGNTFYVGFLGSATLNIEDGGKVVTGGGTVLGNSAAATGTLNISGGGVLQTQSLKGGAGTVQANFDNGILKATADMATFINGFDGTELNILAGGLTIDTGAFTVGTDATSALTGVGGLTKIGSGRLNLAANNTYAGETVIQAGTLALTGAGTISNSSRVVANGTFDISTIAAGGTSIQSLAGSGGVALGAKTLTITNASDTFAGVISGTGGLTLSGGTQTLTGANTYSGGTTIAGGTLAVTSDGALGDVAGALTFNGGALRALASFESTRAMIFTGNGIFDVDPGAVLTLSGGLTGPGGLIKLGQGTLLQNSVVGYSGPTMVGEGILQAGAANVLGGAYSTFAGATLDLAGFDQTIASLDNAGAVRLGGAAPGTTLTVTGNYVGGGGVVYVNTALGLDNSDTDLLDVDGNTSGTSSLVVTNVGGTGAQTVEGIKVINVDGTSGGTFALIGDYVFEGDQAVVGGAYAYRLYQGSVTDPTDGDWYLRSEIIDAGPLYAPTVPLYENYANVLQGFNELGTLQQRVGGREWLNGGETASGDEGAVAPDAIWARMDASQAHFEPGVSTTGASYDVTTWRLQAGLDGVLNQSEAGSLVAGVNAQFGTVNSDISSMYGAGSIDALGFGVGGTLTWYGAGGLYVDGQAQAIWYSADIASDAVGTLVEGNDAFGYGLSIEAGQKIGLDDNWSLTPQAQLSYSAVRFSDFTDQFDGTVSLDDGGDTLVGRLGLSADYEDEWQDANGATNRTHLYGIANLYHDFLDGSSVHVSGTEFVSQNQGPWGGVGIGGSLSWADEQYSVFGEALVRGSVDDFGGNNALGAKVGFNGKW